MGKRIKLWLIITLAALGVSACVNIPNGSLPTATQVPTWTISPSPISSNTPTSTSTELPTPIPTSTPTPTSTSTTTPSPTPFAGGGKIAFWGMDETGIWKVFLTDYSGEHQKIIFDPQDHGYSPGSFNFWSGMDMDWSPNGRFLKFHVIDNTGILYLYLFDDSQDTVTLLANQDVNISSYWSQDGRYIFFNLAGALNVIDVMNNLEVIQIPYPDKAGIPIGLMRDGLIYIVLTELDATNTVVIHSHNHIIYLDPNTGYQNITIEPFDRLLAINLSGSVVRENPFQDDMLAAFRMVKSDTITSIESRMYFSSTEGVEHFDVPTRFYGYNLEDNTLEEILKFPDEIVWRYSISPNGKYLGIELCRPIPNGIGDCHVEILDFETLETVINFSEDEFPFSYISWSPDSQYFVTRTDEYEIIRVNLITGEKISIAKDFLRVDLPHWSP